MEEYSIHFEIPGKPFGKQNPISRNFGKFSSTYLPEKTVNYGVSVAQYFTRAYPEFTPLITPLRILIRAYYLVPQSWSQKKKDKGLTNKIRPTTKPDWDNIGKIIGDALNKIAFCDDKQIVEGIVVKIYSDRPRVEVCISEIKPEETK